jgi:gliding motility-associated-like protein
MFTEEVEAACINVFPYSESFESTKGSWFSGGTYDDWAWGTPSKSKINSAGQGTKCWIAGGLTGNSYSDGERSWVQSPCFDFSNLNFPYIEFKIFIETENGFDGANFQYSINGGTTWINVGSANEPVNCYTANWFNNSGINYLSTLASNTDGWCGSSQATSGSCLGGGATGAWVQAKHCLKFLAGKSNVIFRFAFGAGTTCNNYNGFAFDDVRISNAPKFTANFSSSCITPGSFKFTDLSTNCPTNWRWELANGTLMSTSQSPTYNFTSAGEYTVRLVASNACAEADTIEKKIYVLGAQTDHIDALCFGGNTGKAWVKNLIGNNTNIPVTYSWNTIPAQTSDTAFNLKSGVYSVTISQANTCALTIGVTVSEPTGLNHVIQVSPTICTGKKGSISINESGGIGGYSYIWTPNVSMTNTASGLAQGKYELEVRDKNLCLDTFSVWVNSVVKNITVDLGKDTFLCPGTEQVVLYAGFYSTYLWSDGSVNSSLPVSVPSDYFIQVSDSDGCLGWDSIKVKELCFDTVYMADAFTPDANGWNDSVGGLTLNPSSLTYYHLLIFNRWGEMVFESNDYFNRWNGLYKDKELTHNYFVYILEYQFGQKKRIRKKGHIILVR